jgi:hypothetical protein
MDADPPDFFNQPSTYRWILGISQSFLELAKFLTAAPAPAHLSDIASHNGVSFP